MNINEMKVQDARHFFTIAVAIGDLISAHIMHVISCPETDDVCQTRCDGFIREMVSDSEEGSEESFWDIPSSLAYIEAKKAAEAVLSALDKTRQGAPTK